MVACIVSKVSERTNGSKIRELVKRYSAAFSALLAWTGSMSTFPKSPLYLRRYSKQNKKNYKHQRANKIRNLSAKVKELSGQ